MIGDFEPEDRVQRADDERLDRVAEAFAMIVDAKSPYTGRHSVGVARISVAVGDVLGYSPNELRDLRRAALLHDIGKLGVSNLILDKPGKLDAGGVGADAPPPGADGQDPRARRAPSATSPRPRAPTTSGSTAAATTSA